MDGVWRAWITGALVASVPIAAVLTLGPSQHVFAGTLLTALLAATPGFVSIQGIVESERFLRGMREASGRVLVTEDRLSWGLNRKLTVETPVGSWQIDGVLNPFGQGLAVTPPGAAQTYQIAEKPAKTGRSLMAHLLTAQPLIDPAEAGRDKAGSEIDEVSGKRLML